MMKKEKRKLGKLLLTAVMVCVLAGTGRHVLTAEAAQEDGAVNTDTPELSGSGLILEAKKNVSMKAEPEKTAETLMTFNEGSLLFAAGEAVDGWYYVIYQGTGGYVEEAGLSVLELDIEGLDAEMAASEAETKFVVEVVEKYRADARRSKIWGTVIIVLVAGIFAVGIFSAVRSNKNGDNETGNDGSGSGGKKEKDGKKEKGRDNPKKRSFGKRKEKDLEIEDLN